MSPLEYKYAAHYTWNNFHLNAYSYKCYSSTIKHVYFDFVKFIESRAVDFDINEPFRTSYNWTGYYGKFIFISSQNQLSHAMIYIKTLWLGKRTSIAGSVKAYPLWWK